jgi:putative tryptophan/tyrosine transport system substrate-binding protein
MTARVLRLVSVVTLGLALVVPRATDAQQPAKMTRLGYFAPSRIPHLLDALKDALRELGYVEGQNLEIEYRFAEGQSETFDELAAELVGLSPDAIVTFATPPTMAVKRATATIPIIMAGTGDPVRAGAVASLARPGGNVTGVTVYAPELSSKRLELLKQTVPEIARVAVLGNGRNPYNRYLWGDTQPAGRALGIDLRLVMVDELGDLAAAFSNMKREGADALLVLADARLNGARQLVTDLAAEHWLPGMYEGREFVEVGGLMSYGPSLAELHRRAAAFVDEVLKGADPAELPVEQPTKFELVVNLRTAQALRLTISPSVLARADEVIE